jgi:hypothetical protein
MVSEAREIGSYQPLTRSRGNAWVIGARRKPRGDTKLHDDLGPFESAESGGDESKRRRNVRSAGAGRRPGEATFVEADDGGQDERFETMAGLAKFPFAGSVREPTFRAMTSHAFGDCSNHPVTVTQNAASENVISRTHRSPGLSASSSSARSWNRSNDLPISEPGSVVGECARKPLRTMSG